MQHLLRIIVMIAVALAKLALRQHSISVERPRWSDRPEHSRARDPAPVELVRKLAAFEGSAFTWVFSEAPASAITRPVVYNRASQMHGCALRDIERALENFRRYREMYSMRDVWVDPSEPIVLADEDLPAWFGVN